MADWKGKSRGGVAGYRIFVWSIRHAGLNFAYFLLIFVAAYFLVASPPAFKAMWEYFRKRQRWGRFRSFFGIYRNYFLFGQVLIDKTAILSGMLDRFTFRIEGKEYIESMHNGGFLISGHIGNWEVGGKALDVVNRKINIIVFDAEHQAIKNYMSDVLTDRNVNFICIREDYSHLREIETALNNKELIAMHGDRYIEGNQVAHFDFLGGNAAFPLGPWSLASRFNVPVCYVFAVKQSKRQYRFFATPAMAVPKTGNPLKRREMISECMERYVRELETAARQYPLQWYNYFQFWKTGQT